MKNIFFPAVMLFLFAGCVTGPENGYTSLPTSRTFHVGIDRVWGALVSEISAFAVIEAIDKTKGTITTGPLRTGSGLMSEVLLKEYAHRPRNIVGTWDAGRVVLSIFAKPQGSSTNVRIVARFTGLETNVAHAWVEWPTKGVLENFLLDRIAKEIEAQTALRQQQYLDKLAARRRLNYETENEAKTRTNAIKAARNNFQTESPHSSFVDSGPISVSSNLRP
jgi:hypothetical protein